MKSYKIFYFFLLIVCFIFLFTSCGKKEQLKDAREIWEEANLRNYSFVYSSNTWPNNFCATIIVKEDSFYQAIDCITGKLLQKSHFTPTIDTLHTFIENHLHNKEIKKNTWIKVTYGHNGVPKIIETKDRQDGCALDDCTTQIIDNFREN